MVKLERIEKLAFQAARHACSLPSIRRKAIVVAILVVGKSRFVGVNSHKHHPYYFPKRIHAEMVAIQQYNNGNWANVGTGNFYRQIPEKTILYVARFLRNGSLALAKPCKYCNKLITDVGIKTVVFTTSNGWQETKIEG